MEIGEDDGWKIFACWSRDNDFLGASFDVGHGFFFGAIEASAFENDINTDFAPGEVFGLGFGVDGDFLAIDGDGTRNDNGLAIFFEDRFFGSDGVKVLADGTAIAFLGGVVLQEVGEHRRAGEVVDGDDFVAFGTKHLTESKTADASESVDCNFD